MINVSINDRKRFEWEGGADAVAHQEMARLAAIGHTDDAGAVDGENSARARSIHFGRKSRDPNADVATTIERENARRQ